MADPKAQPWWRRVWHALSIRFDRSPIATLDQLVEFNRARSAYIAQTSLFGYLKTRMGIRYPEIFQDDTFTPSINLAKSRTFAACLADLTVFAVALTARENGWTSDEAAAFARDCYAAAINRSLAEGSVAIDTDLQIARFAERIALIAWPSAAIGENAFTASPAELIASAPIADELKKYDTEIVANSIRFRWRDVREQLRRRLDAAALGRDWKAGNRR